MEVAIRARAHAMMVGLLHGSIRRRSSDPNLEIYPWCLEAIVIAKSLIEQKGFDLSDCVSSMLFASWLQDVEPGTRLLCEQVQEGIDPEKAASAYLRRVGEAASSATPLFRTVPLVARFHHQPAVLRRHAATISFGFPMEDRLCAVAFANVMAGMIQEGAAADPIQMALDDLPRAADELSRLAPRWSAEVLAARHGTVASLRSGTIEVDPMRLEPGGLEVLVKALKSGDEASGGGHSPLTAIIGALRGARTGIVVADAENLAGNIDRHDEDPLTGAWIAPVGSLLRLVPRAA